MIDAFSSLKLLHPRKRLLCYQPAMRSRGDRLARSSWWPKSSLTPTCKHRSFRIQAAPTTTTPLDLTPSASSTSSPDARFEVLGTPSSLLSINLSASQHLYTRRGTLVAVSGSPEHAISSLSPLSPVARGPLGVPFLYQRITSTSPLNILIGAKSAATSFAVVNLDGRLDWKIVQRKGLLAWTGQTLTVKTGVDTSMVCSHFSVGRTSV